MANGLRKLIKRARKELNNPAVLARRRFGPRLNVEELEERIAPATFTLGANEYVPYDVTGGAGILYNSGVTAVQVTVTDNGGAGVADNIAILGNTAGVVTLLANEALTSGAAATALVTDSAGITLNLSTGVATNVLAGGASTPNDANILTDFDAVNDPGTAAPLAIATAATVNLAAVNGNLTGTLTLDDSNSNINTLAVNAGADTGAFAGSITTDQDLNNVTIAGVATGTLWDIGDEATGVWAIGTSSVTAIQTATDWDAAFTSTNTLSGAITIGGNLTNLIRTNGASQHVTATFAINGTGVGATGNGIDTAGGIAAAGATSNVTGAISVPNANIGGVGIVATGAITSATISAENISGPITAGTNINSAISATDTAALAAPVGIGITGTIGAGTSIAGSITSAAPGGNIALVQALGGAMGATVNSANVIGTVSATSGRDATSHPGANSSRRVPDVRRIQASSHRGVP